MVSDPIQQRPDPWLGYFKTDMQEIMEVMADANINQDAVMQIRGLMRLADTVIPTVENANGVVKAMDSLEKQWNKSPWSAAFPRLHRAVAATLSLG